MRAIRLLGLLLLFGCFCWAVMFRGDYQFCWGPYVPDVADAPPARFPDEESDGESGIDELAKLLGGTHEHQAPTILSFWDWVATDPGRRAAMAQPHISQTLFKAWLALYDRYVDRQKFLILNQLPPDRRLADMYESYLKGLVEQRHREPEPDMSELEELANLLFPFQAPPDGPVEDGVVEQGRQEPEPDLP